jgi:predicted ATPase/signal transduction histidine kinase
MSGGEWPGAAHENPTTEHIAGCEVLETLHRGVGSVVYRGRRSADGLPVVIKMGAGAPARLPHEHAMLVALDGQGAPRSHGVTQTPAGWALLLEDIGGRSLADLGIAGRMSATELLGLAIAIVDALERVHHRRVVHKDVNPTNLVWRRPEAGPEAKDDGRLVLVDFGIATVLPRETAAFVSPGRLEGTLAYISPEQTGRINRSLDYRTDYYSLGVTLYELAAGRLPFDAGDPLELVHCHIARQPPPLHEMAPAVPRAFADIVHKLMAKSADERYQSAHGIRADLERCLQGLAQGSESPGFELGREDRSERFHLPQELYGRKHEIQRVLAAFERASTGTATLIMVSGNAGIGKSALIREVYRPLTVQRGYFIAGKFDQYRNSPYAALLQALRALITQILTESQERISAWRTQLLDALHGNVDVLVDVCPELALITGPQSSVATIPPADARHRFQQAVRALLGVFASPEHPLCMFLDDLQWTDADTLALLAELMHAARTLPLLIIGAYRDNEVGPTHPLELTLEKIEEQGGRIERLALAPLALDDVTSLVAAALSMPAAEVVPLAALLRARTGGNPFFLRAFLTALYEDGLLAPAPTGWRWDTDRIRQRGVTDNVVDLMVDRIQRLPQGTQEMLRVAACLGNELELGILAVAAGRPLDAMAHELWPAIAEELVLALDPVHSAVELASGGVAIRCRFAHDRIQQAVLSTSDEQALAALHATVGRRMLDQLGPEAREQRLFDIVDHLNHGQAASDASGREELARLNRQAAHKALKAAAARPALGYARAGLALLDGGDWQAGYELVRDLHLEAAGAAFVGGELETLDELAAAVLAHARDVMDKVAIWKLQGQVCYAQQRFQEGIDIYLHALGEIGVALPARVAPEDRTQAMQATAAALGERVIDDLHALPACAEPRARAAMEILDHMVVIAYTIASDLFPVAICRLVQLSLAHGNTPYSAFGYIMYGLLLSNEHDLDRAARIGRMALRLADRFGDKDILSRTYLYAHYQLLHWKEPLYQLSPALLSAYRFGMEAGSRFHAACSAATQCINRFLAGAELGKLAADAGKYSELMEQLRQPMVLSWHQPYEQAAINLHRGAPDPCRFAGPAYDADARVPTYAANDHAALFNYHYCKAFVCYVLGDFAAAAASAEAAETHQAITSTALWAGPWTFLDSLCRLAVYERSGEAERARILEVVAQNQAKLAQWLPHCPVSFEHKLRLVEAELARVLGHRDEAEAKFDVALALAQRSGYVHEAALAAEIVARFHLDVGQAERARDMLRQAHRDYLRWGAITKVKALEQRYAQLLPRVATSALDTLTLATIDARDWDVSVLDLVGVLSASQALSREIEREQLLARLMALVIEIAGAEAGALLLARGDTWVVEAEKAVDDRAAVLQSIPMDELEARGHRGLPVAVVRYVARTQSQVVLDDAGADAQFGRDPYIARHRVKSVLCVPLARQGGQRGILYLENNLVRGAFTPARIHVLQLLSTQAVISLENAMLYDTLEQKVADRTRELGAKNQELGATLDRLRETQARMVVQERLASLGTLAAGIAHELRNPLNFVNNFAKLSLRHLAALASDVAAAALYIGADPAQRMERNLANLELNLSKIDTHGQRMDGIIRSMLDHSRGGTGERADVDLNALVGDYVKLAYYGMRARPGAIDIEIDMQLDPALAPVHVAPQEIGRVVINLIDNACYALAAKQRSGAGDAPPRIEVRTRELGTAVEIRVRDNGTGVPESMRARVFDPFFTTKQAGEGTGLGLSISHEIVAQGYRGSLTFDSRDGEFTEFVINLPRS